jgi:2-oxoglutarate ferredoxin oxidoreductase subunit gamma
VSGFGGQGVLTLGKLICQAAIAQGRQVTYLPSYGAEVRGGTANCQIVLAAGEVLDPLIPCADALIALNGPSLERFGPRLAGEGLLVLNTSLVAGADDALPPHGRIVRVPATERAAALGEIRAANMLALGAYARASDFISEQAARQAVADLFAPRGAKLVELNLKAFDEGAAMAG